MLACQLCCPTLLGELEEIANRGNIAILGAKRATLNKLIPVDLRLNVT